MSILEDLEYIKKQYEKLIKIFPEDQTLKRYYKKVSHSIEKIQNDKPI